MRSHHHDDTSEPMPASAPRVRAWSRAGAVAEVLARRPARRALTLSTQVALLLAGSFLIAASVAVTLWNELGPGPLDVFIGGIRAHTGLSLTLAVWLTIGTMTVGAWLLGRRPGFGTLLAPLVIGPALEAAVAALDVVERPDSLVIRLAFHLVAIGAIGIGSGALIVSGLGAGSGELLASAASDRSGRTEPRVRVAFELTWLVLGIALGGPAGLGTVVVALAIGRSVANGYRIVDAAMARTRLWDVLADPATPAPAITG